MIELKETDDVLLAEHLTSAYALNSVDLSVLIIPNDCLYCPTIAVIHKSPKGLMVQCVSMYYLCDVSLATFGQIVHDDIFIDIITEAIGDTTDDITILNTIPLFDMPDVNSIGILASIMAINLLGVLVPKPVEVDKDGYRLYVDNTKTNHGTLSNYSITNCSDVRTIVYSLSKKYEVSDHVVFYNAVDIYDMHRMVVPSKGMSMDDVNHIEYVRRTWFYDTLYTEVKKTGAIPHVYKKGLKELSETEVVYAQNIRELDRHIAYIIMTELINN